MKAADRHIVRMRDVQFEPSLFRNYLTGTALDELLCSYKGLPKGVNYMVIGDPGVGKTTVIMDMLSDIRMLSTAARVLFISAEMNEIDLAVYVQRFPKFKDVDILFIKADFSSGGGGAHCLELLTDIFSSGWDVVAIDSFYELQGIIMEMPDTVYIADSDHYNKVLSRVAMVKSSLWIATADIKDLHVMVGQRQLPFLGVLAKLLEKGLEIRLMHAKEPGPIFREDFDRYPILSTALERVLCPRIHFKMMIFDHQMAYVGSANLTGAGIGMKSGRMRNFEAGILTSDPGLVTMAAEHFDSVWRGARCKDCGRKQFCSDPIIQ